MSVSNHHIHASTTNSEIGARHDVRSVFNSIALAAVLMIVFVATSLWPQAASATPTTPFAVSAASATGALKATSATGALTATAAVAATAASQSNRSPATPITTQNSSGKSLAINTTSVPSEQYPPPGVGTPRPISKITKELRETEESLSAVQSAELATLSTLRGVRAEQTQIEADIKALELRVAESRGEQAASVIAWYVNDPTIGAADSIQTFGSNVTNDAMEIYGSAALEQKSLVLDSFQEALTRLVEYRNKLTVLVADLTLSLIAAHDNTLHETLHIGGLRAELGAAEDGYALNVDEFAFPVAGDYSFGNSWLADRLPGSAQAHLHVGTDILAPQWTPLVAVENGVVTMIGSNGLGGRRIWLIGASGARYYYAHLVDWPVGIYEGMSVRTGQVIGFNGDTGDAKGGVMHLHFEIHPAGTPHPVNPYPVLRAVDAGTHNTNDLGADIANELGEDIVSTDPNVAPSAHSDSSAHSADDGHGHENDQDQSSDNGGDN